MAMMEVFDREWDLVIGVSVGGEGEREGEEVDGGRIGMMVEGLESLKRHWEMEKF